MQAQTIRYEMNSKNFNKIPGNQIAYWVSDNFVNIFNNSTLYKFSTSPGQNVTGNNEKFLRKWWEVFKNYVNQKDYWIFYAKGGGFRKWYGLLDNVIDWRPNSRYIYRHGDGIHSSSIINDNYWYKKAITWGLITSAIPSFRVMPEGATFDKGGSSIIVNEELYNFVIALLNSKVYVNIASVLNPTLNFQVNDIRSVPLIFKKTDIINRISLLNILLCRQDWDLFENSWDFKKHPLI